MIVYLNHSVLRYFVMQPKLVNQSPQYFPGEEVKWSHSVVSDSLRPHRLQPARLFRLWDFPGNSTGVDCHFLLQGIFPTQGSNPGLPHCRQRLYHLSHQGSPFLLREILNSYFHGYLLHHFLKNNTDQANWIDKYWVWDILSVEEKIFRSLFKKIVLKVIVFKKT